MIKNLILIGLGGGLGSILRYLSVLYFKENAYPWATLFVNILGSFIIGIVVALFLKNGNWPLSYRLFLATGICGGFTTFSSFSLENMELLSAGKYGLALFYICISIMGGLLACWWGYRLVQT